MPAARIVFVRLSGTTTETINAHTAKPFKVISSTYAPTVAAFGTAEFINGSEYHVAALRKNSGNMIAYVCNEQTPSGVTVNGTIMWKH
jgi:predicted TIM-barrel fold metal-dependent hydrolase